MRRRRNHAALLAIAAILAGGCSGATDDSASTPSAAPARKLANPDDYASRGSRYPQWGFLTPSSRWICAIASLPSGGDFASCAANPGQGPLPIAGAPFARPPEGGTSRQKPNVITVREGSDPEFESLGQRIWSPLTAPRTLPYDTVLQVGGFSCNAQQSVISCREDATGKGFSFSTEGYRLAYTDVPVG